MRRKKDPGLYSLGRRSSMISQNTCSRNFCASWMRAVSSPGTISSTATGLLECREDVARLAAGAQHDEDIARLRKCGDLPGKDFGEFVVVANGRQQAGIHGEGHRGIGTPVFLEAAGELRGQVGAVTGASSVAAEEELVTGQKCVAGQRGRLF